MSDEFPPVALTPPAGVVKSESDRVVEGRWVDTQWVRFVGGKPQKIGGWTKQTSTVSEGALRQLHAWRDLSSTEYMAGGTYKKLYVYERDFTQHDITPLEATGTLNDPFTTTDESASVSVAHTAHGRNPGDIVIFSSATPVGGLTLNGTFEVFTVDGANSYTIVAAEPATSSESGGGTVTYQYEISIGVDRGAYGLGYGIGGYGLLTYGDARPDSIIFIEPRSWSFDHFGKILLSAYNGGSIYSFDPNAIPAWPRATKISDAPDDVRFMMITEERFVLALCDGMRMDWCSQGDYTTWTPDSTNTANTRRVSEGTKLIAAKSLGGHITCVWSDFALYINQYTGSSSIFSTRLAGRNCGLVSPSCAVTANGVAYWMGHNNFFYYNGSVNFIPNVEDIRDYVFDSLRKEYAYLAWGQYLEKYNEVIWCWVSLGQDDPSYYAILSLNDYSWAAGEIVRCAGAAFSDGDTRPYWSGPDGHIYLHENGVDGDGEAIEARVALGPSSLRSGAANFDIDGFMADFHDQAGDLTVKLEAWDRLRHPTIDSETVTVTEDDDLIDLRLSGRYINLTVTSDTIGGYFRFGKPDVMISSNGTRR